MPSGGDKLLGSLKEGRLWAILYPRCCCPLAQNDLLLLFTDGLYEVTNAGQEEYGQGRLKQTLRKHLHRPTESLLDDLLEDVQRFAGAGDFEDDVCLAGAEVRRLGVQG